MPNTNFWGWTYPDENLDPHYEMLESFFVRQDATSFALLNTASNIIIPPAVLSWAPITKTLSWTGYFEIPIMSTGFTFKIMFGPDGINPSVSFNDGERLIVTVPNSISGNSTANFAKTSGALTVVDGLFTVGFCRGSKFYANFPQVYS